MKLSEQLKVISNMARVRIIRGKPHNREPQLEDKDQCEIIYSGYKNLMEYESDKASAICIEDPNVNNMIAHMEVRHRNYREYGLLPPYEPDITRQYEFNDLTILLYYDIYVDRQARGDHEERTDSDNGNGHI